MSSLDLFNFQIGKLCYKKQKWNKKFQKIKRGRDGQNGKPMKGDSTLLKIREKNKIDSILIGLVKSKSNVILQS